jgi:NitT/TauT family transport system substrate-binding protein
MPLHPRLTRGSALASLGALVAAAALPAPAVAADPVKLNIAMVPTQSAAQGYFATDAGYFVKHGISPNLTELQNGPAVISAVLSGGMDVGYSNVLSFTVAHDKGLPLQVLSGTDFNGLAKPTTGLLCVLVASPIKTAKDLAGKIVGVSSLSNTNLYAVKNWIDKMGGDSKLSKYVEIPLAEMPAALEAGRVDATSLDASYLSAQASKIRMLANTYYAIAPGFVAGVWFATTSWIKDHPAIAQAFVAAIRDASIWANKNQTDALKIYSKYCHISVTDLQTIPIPVYVEKTQAINFQPIIDVAAKYGAIKAPFPAKDLLSVYAQ